MKSNNLCETTDCPTMASIAQIGNILPLYPILSLMALTNPRADGGKGREGRERKGKGGQLGSVWKASLKSNVFNCLLNGHKEGAGQSSSGGCFHKVGATTKKALPLVEDL